MAFNTLETLVLGSLATLRGGRSVELCLGTSAKGNPTAEIVISMRHSANQVSEPQGSTPGQKPAVADRQADAWVGGAGRSLSAGCSRSVAAGSSAARPTDKALPALSGRSNPLAGFNPATRRTATCGIRGR